MSLEDTWQIDAIGTEIGTGSCILTIADPRDWDNEQEHLEALQAKINAYLEFIDNGQIYREYPEAEGRPLVIDIVFRWDIPKAATTFLTRACELIIDLHVQLRYRVMKEIC